MLKLFRPAYALMFLVHGSSAFAADAPGVTQSEIKVGGVFPFSGPASSIGLVGRGILAYVQSINDRGGCCRRCCLASASVQATRST